MRQRDYDVTNTKRAIGNRRWALIWPFSKRSSDFEPSNRMSPISTFLLSLAISRNGARASLQPRRCAIRAARRHDRLRFDIGANCYGDGANRRRSDRSNHVRGVSPKARSGAEVQLNKRDFGFGGDSIPSVSGGCRESPTLRSRRQRHREVRTGIFPLIAAATQ